MPLINTETNEDGNTLYDVRGLLLEYFLLSIKKMNMTGVFLQPSLDVSFEAAVTEVTMLTAVIADLVVSTVPLVPIATSERLNRLYRTFLLRSNGLYFVRHQI